MCSTGRSGGIGEHGEGMKGGGDGVSSGVYVSSSHPLTDYIGRGGTGFANEIMNTRDSMEREYGSAIKNIKLHVGKLSGSALGAYGDDTLYMNEKYVKNAYLNEAMRNTDGFHPGIGNRTGAEAVAAHEIGHRLGEIAAKRANISEKDIVGRAARSIGVKTANVAGHISGYARTNYSETIAEAISDVYCNGKNASRASRAIDREIKKILR